jgi:p-hydroxybenzoate 3-monooxygenase
LFIEPMQYGRLFLVGDAAHIVPPSAAKGLNLAVADVRLLAAAFIAWYAEGKRALLDGYSRAALTGVWQGQEFSAFMTRCCTGSRARTATRSSYARPGCAIW